MRHLRSVALVVVVAGCARVIAPTPGPKATVLDADVASYAYRKRTRRDPNDLCVRQKFQKMP